MPLIQLYNPNYKSIETCINEAYASFDVPPLGGASGDGWSKMNDFQRCPYRYWLRNERVVDVDVVDNTPKPVALELGSLYHATLAMHYMQAAPTQDVHPRTVYPTAFALLERVLSLGGDAEIVNEVKRLYTAYFNHYHNPHDEGIAPLAIELPAGKDELHTCRYDLLAERRNAGVWIVEHKTASRETRDVIESWWLDGEILGEVYAYKLSGLANVYGPLVGVLVNIVIKTQTPKFRRVEVVVPDELVNRYAGEIAYWRGLRQSMRTTGNWPRKLNGCIGRYDTCQHWDHCRDAEATDSGRLVRLLSDSLKVREV